MKNLDRSPWCLLAGFFLLLSLPTTPVTAQQRTTGESITEVYDRVTLYPLGPGRYAKHDTLYTGAARMKSEFAISDGGLKLYVRSQRNRSISIAFSLGVAVLPTRTVATSNKPFYQRPLYYVSLGLGIVSSIFNARATSQLNQAVWLRNRDALLDWENKR